MRGVEVVAVHWGAPMKVCYSNSINFVVLVTSVINMAMYQLPG